MPGIFGIFGNQGNKEISEKMKSLLTHNEDWFDGTIMYHEFGFHGIVDFKSNLDHDCFHLKNKSIIIFGVIYSFEDHKIEGRKSEYLLKQYEEKGINFLDNLNGSYIISIYDNGKNFLATDKIGTKNTFYFVKNKNLYFSSEIKSILASNELKPSINKESVFEYFTYSYILGTKTFFEGIEIIPPGTFILFENGQIQFKKYYDIATIRRTNKSLDFNNLIKEFARIMEISLERTMIDKECIGIFLSGGLDSRLLAGIAKRVADKKNIKLISFTFGTKGGRQEKIARKIAKKLKIENIFYEIPTNAISKFAKEIVYKGEGDARIRDAHFISLLREVRKKVDTVIIGLFCSELFGQLMLKDLSNSISSTNQLTKYLFSQYNLKPLSKHRPYLFSKDFLTHNELKSKKELIKTVVEIKLDSFNDVAHLWEILQRCRRYIIPITKYINWYLEPRLPFLDDKVIDFALQLPINLKIDKKFIKKANIRLFPELSTIMRENTGLPINTPEIVLKIVKYERFLIEKIKQIIERISQNKIKFRNLDYRAYDYLLRKGSKEFILNVLIRHGNKNIWNMDYIKKIVYEHLTSRKNNNVIICDSVQFQLLDNLYFEKK